MKHQLSIQARPRGGGSKGTNLRCTCRTWETFTNDLTPSRAKGWANRQFAAHLEKTTVEGDIAALKALISHAQGLVTKAIAEDDAFTLEGWGPRLADLHAELAADLRRQAEQED